MRDDYATAQARVTDATVTVRAYQGTEVHRAMGELCDALAESYKLQLADVTVESLPRLQGALKQCLALRKCLDPQAELTLPQI